MIRLFNIFFHQFVFYYSSFVPYFNTIFIFILYSGFEVYYRPLNYVCENLQETIFCSNEILSIRLLYGDHLHTITALDPRISLIVIRNHRPIGLPQDVPGAIYTISKNVLGRNVTDFIREALPSIAPTVPMPATASMSNYVLSNSNVIADANGASNNCLTPDGQLG